LEKPKITDSQADTWLKEAIQAALQGMIDNGRFPVGSKIDWETAPEDLPPITGGILGWRICFIYPDGRQGCFDMRMKLPKDLLQ